MDLSEIAELKRMAVAQFEERMRAIDIVREMLEAKDIQRGQSGSHRATAVSSHVVPPNTSAGDSEATIRPQHPDEHGTLIDTVLAVLEQSRRTWTAPQMLGRLREIKFPLAAKNPAPSVGTALMRLADRGSAVLVKKGSGRNPNAYAASKWIDRNRISRSSERESPAVSAPGSNHVSEDVKQETADASALE